MSALARYLAAALIFGIATSSFAGTIDNTGAVVVTIAADDPTRTVGGTFTADDSRLASFTLLVNQVGGIDGSWVAVVYGTDGTGVPTGSVLWQSASQLEPAGSVLFTFTPGLAITASSAYFIGITRVPPPPGSDSRWAASLSFTANTRPGGLFFTTAAGAPTTSFSTQDIYSTIVMNPEPGTLALFGLGALGLGAAVLRRRKSAVRA